jgi:hypothetical protein
MTKTLALLTTGLLLAATSVNASAKTHFETRICRGCDYNHALTTATAFKPANSITDANVTVRILVINADTRVMWGFEKIGDNQVTYTPNLPDGTKALANRLLSNFQALHRMTVEKTEQLTKENNKSLPHNTGDDSCQNSGHKEALDATFSPFVRNTIQRTMQNKSYDDYGFIANMSALTMTGSNFNISNSDVSLDGSWQVASPSMRVNINYGPQNINRPNQVGFKVIVTDRQIEVVINDIRTYFDGISLKSIQNQTTSASLYTECMGKAMDEMFPKVVSSSNTPSWKSTNLIDGSHTCKHTYYHNGSKIASIEGACPQ